MEKQMTLAEEAGLPESWHPVDSDPIIPSSTPPGPNKMAPLFGGSISPTLQHDAVFVGTQYGSPNIPPLPLMPLSPSGQPTVGAATQSVSTRTIVEQTSVISSAVASGSNGAIQFSKNGALTSSLLFSWDNTNNVLNIGGTAALFASLSSDSDDGSLIFGVNTGVSKWSIDGTSFGWLATTDNSYDIGAAGANRPRTGYFGTSLVTPLVNATTGFQVNGAAQSTVGGLPIIIAAGTAALGTSLISANTSASTVTVSATGVLSTDSIMWSFNAAPSTGYISGCFVLAYPTSGHVNFVVVNPTAGSLTPAAATLNWKVLR